MAAAKSGGGGESYGSSREGTPRRAVAAFPSPSSSSSSDFEFTVSLSPTSRRSSSQLYCPADELFYKGQLLPLHPSPRISMVRTLFLSSSSTSSSSTDTTARDSNGSSSSTTSSSSVPADLLLPLECDSSRPSSVTEDEARKAAFSSSTATNSINKRNKYFSSFANRFSSVFLHRGGSTKKDPSIPMAFDLDYQIPSPPPPPPPPSSVKKTNSSARQAIKKLYVEKVRPLYERLSPKNQNHNQNQNQSQNHNQNKKKTFSFSIRRQRDHINNNIIEETMKKLDEEAEDDDHAAADSGRSRGFYSHSFSGNLRFPRRKRCAGSCPSSMRSSPTHSGLLRIGGGGVAGRFPTDSQATLACSSSSSTSSMEELQSAIQGAIAHCKSTMLQAASSNQTQRSLN